MTQTFSVRSNAIRNARRKLGKDAQQGVHFAIGGDKASGYNWAPITDAPPVSEAAEAEKTIEALMATETPVETKPAVKKVKAPKAIKAYLRKRGDDVTGKRLKLIQMITSKNGASLDAICSKLGWQKHTVRGAISTAASQGVIVKLESYRSARDKRRIYRAVKAPVKKVAA